MAFDLNSFIGNHIRFIANWGQWVVAAVGLASTYAGYRVLRSKGRPLSSPWLRWPGAIALLLVAVSSGLIFARLTVIKPGAMAILDRLDALVDRPAPALDYRLVATDRAESLDDLRGRVVLVNFWATWCAPCRAEMPDLDQLQRDHSDQGLTVLTISDEPRDKLVAHDAEFEYAMRSVYLERFPWVDMGSERPITFLVDRQGVVRDYFTGPWDHAYFSTEIAPYL